MELEAVFLAHQQAVFAYFLRLVGNRHDAEELTQETFFREPGPSSVLPGAGSGTVVAPNVYRSPGFVAG